MRTLGIFLLHGHQCCYWPGTGSGLFFSTAASRRGTSVSLFPAAGRASPCHAVQASCRDQNSRSKPENVAIGEQYATGSIVIVNHERALYFVEEAGRALRYPVGIGTSFDQWEGVETITAKRENPKWYPTEDIQWGMGVPPLSYSWLLNLLGQRALYLGDTLYRIHGTNRPGSIGGAASGTGATWCHCWSWCYPPSAGAYRRPCRTCRRGCRPPVRAPCQRPTMRDRSPSPDSGRCWLPSVAREGHAGPAPQYSAPSFPDQISAATPRPGPSHAIVIRRRENARPVRASRRSAPGWLLDSWISQIRDPPAGPKSPTCRRRHGPDRRHTGRRRCRRWWRRKRRSRGAIPGRRRRWTGCDSPVP